MLQWITQNWYELLQSVGIISGLAFTGLALRLDVESRRVSNLIDLTGAHREIWSQYYRRPALVRVLDPTADVAEKGITEEERTFVTLIIVHLSSVFHAIDRSLSVRPEGLERDVQALLSLPIPRAVWNQLKSIQNRKFVRFVESCLTR